VFLSDYSTTLIHYLAVRTSVLLLSEKMTESLL